LIPRRPLGATGAEIPVLGLGISGPHAAAWTRAGHTEKLIRRAVALGVTAFDTAPFYGAGEAETRLGRAIEGLDRDTLFLSTKAGTYREGGAWKKDFSAEGVRASLEASLARLGVGAVDAFFLHGPGADQMTDGLMTALSDMKAEGKYRFLGMCGRGNEIYAALDTRAFDLLMAPVHVRLTPPEAKRISAARDAGLGLFGIEIFSPSMGGPRIPTRPADLRVLAKWARGDRRMRSYLKPDECLKYAVASGACDCALFSTTRLKHLEANADAARTLDLNQPPS